MSQAQKRKFRVGSTEDPDDEDEDEDVDVKKPCTSTQDGRALDTTDTNVSSLLSLPGTPVIEIGEYGLNVIDSGALGVTVIHRDGRVQPSGVIHQSVPSEMMGEQLGPNEVMHQHPESPGVTHQYPGSLGVTHRYPGSSGVTHQHPASSAGMHQQQGSLGVTHQYPGSSGVMHQHPGSLGVTHQYPGSSGVTHQHPGSLGVTHQHPESSGVTHQQPASSGVTHQHPGSLGVTHQHHGSLGVTHQYPGSSEVTHQYPGSLGVTHQYPGSLGVGHQYPGSLGMIHQHPRSSGVTPQHTDDRFKNICDATEYSLKHDRTEYVSTYAQRSAQTLLTDCGCIFLKGMLGSGKSRLGRRLLEEMSMTDGRTALLLTSADEWSLIPKNDKTDKPRSQSERYIVMIDDIFGATNFSQSHFDDWTRKFDIMWPSIESGHIFLILTSRSEITAQCQCQLNKHSLMKNIRHFLIDDGQYALQKKEKEKMLKVICHGKFSEKEVEEIVKIETVLGFPQVCTFFASSREAQRKGLSFFKKPNEYVQQEVDALKESDGLSYLVLLLVLMSDGHLNATSLDPRKCTSDFKEMVEMMKEYCPNLPTRPSLFGIQKKADSLCGGYLKQSQNGYAFQHQSVYESVFISISEQFPSSCIRTCPSFVLGEVVRTKRLDGDIRIVLIPEENYDVFADRITELLLSAEHESSKMIRRHPSLKHKEFISFLVQRWAKNGQLTSIMQCKHFVGFVSWKSKDKEIRISKCDYLLSKFVMDSNDHLVQVVLNSIPSPEKFKDIIQECLPCAIFVGSNSFVKWCLDHGAEPNENCFKALFVNSGQSLKNDVIDRIFNGFVTANLRGKKLCYSPELGKGYAIGQILTILLLHAVRMGHTYIVKLTVHMLKHKDDNLNVISVILSWLCDQMQTHQPKYTVFSSRECLKEMIQILLSTGCKLHCQHLLLSASAHSDATVLNLLLNLETDILQTRNYVDDNKYSTKYATPQEQAAAYGSTESLDILLKYSQDISQRFRVVAANTFLLHRAAQHGNDKCADFLLVKGFQVDLKDNDGNTPLHLAAQNSHLECVKILLQHKAPVNLENREGLVPLSVVEIVNREIVKALVVAESILNQMDGKGRTILHKAVLCNDLETVKFLCSKEADVNILSQCGSQTRSVVHLACEYADIEILKFLCNSGARIEAVDADKRPIVHMAACSRVDALEKLTFLIDVQKHLPDAEDKDGRTAIFSAIDTHVDTYGVEILEFLLNRGVSVNHKDASKDNILLCLLKTPFRHNNIIKMVDLLVKRGVDLNAMDSRGTTALRLAIEDMIYDAAELILKHGNTDREFDPNRRDDFGKTCLHYATEQRKSELWERFRDTPDLFLYSFSQYCYLQSPCMLYCARANYTLTEMLLEQGVNPHLQDIMGRNPLHYAAGCGKPKTVKLLLEKGIDPNVRDGMGWTPFHMAAVHGGYRTVSALLDSGIDANIQDNQGMTALHLVVTMRGFHLQSLEENYDYAELSCLGPCEFLKLFLEKGVDPNIPDKLGRTALHYASDHSDNSSVMLLLDHGADSDVQDLWGMTPLHRASTKKSSVLKLLLDHGADPCLRDQQGMTALHCASTKWRCNIEAFQMLLKSGVDPNVIDEQGRTALHYASQHSDKEIVKLLLEYNADPGVKDIHGMTSLHYAAKAKDNSCDILEIVLKKSVGPNILDKKGRTALHYASENSDKERVELLLDRGADPSVKDLQGMTSLHCAATNSYGALQTLIERGVDPNILDNKRRTALHYASERGSEDSVKLLFDRCADPGVQDLQGMSALHCAVHLRRYRSDVLPILLEKGIHPNCLDKQGRTALHYASENSMKESVKLLLEYNADLGVKDIHGMTSLHYAAKAKDNSCDILEILLRKSVGPNIIDNRGRTALHYASENSDKESVKLLLEYNADPGVKDIHDMTSLHYAAKANDNSCVILEILLKKSVGPNIIDKRGRTALHYASENSDKESVKLLLEYNADPGVKDIHDMTSLHYAAKAKDNSCDILEILLRKSVGPNIIDNRGRTALHYASENSDKESVKLLLEYNADPGVKDIHDMTSLHYAAKAKDNSCDILEIVLKKSVGPNILDKKGRTALHYASENSDKERVELLLDLGADPSVKDLQGMTSLHCAAMNSYGALQTLIERGVDPNILDKKRRTALHYASERGSEDSVKLLLDRCADPGVQDLQGMSALHCAVHLRRYRSDVLPILLEKGIYPNCLDKQGRTALHYASENSMKESVKLLLEYNADPDVQNIHGMTSLHYAAKAKDNSCDILEMLLEQSVDPNIPDKKGRTALHYALEPSPVKNIKPVQHGAYTEVEDWLRVIPLHPKPLHPRPSDTIPLLTKTGARRTTIYRREFEQEYGILLCEYRRMNMLEMLLKKVDPKIQDHKGRTALHYAAQASRNETLEILSELGVTVHKENDQDRAFFRAAADRSYNRCERVKLLLRRGVDKTVRDIQGRTAEQYATELSDINP
ncbi:uncharacterized protein LOC124253630 [Haliotis rubra]|uniref:uncharacterized protein LOC124253630 n=1 Tax=Haliotis rubra TaxID=36100 RepID=UPI001EE50D2E|nr:uncharacterized protein LOC124253630 [Haliotis rubra]